MKTKLDILAIATFLAGMTFISLASPALYVLLAIAAGFISVGVVSFVVTTKMLASDCPLANILGMQAVASLASALLSSSD